jgi:cystathionine beta-lyase/cystathionine gamma-synthase
MSGFGSLISIDLPDAKTAEAFIDGCSLWVLATSLGGVESTFERRRRWQGERRSVPEGLVRMSLGSNISRTYGLTLLRLLMAYLSNAPVWPSETSVS